MASVRAATFAAPIIFTFFVSVVDSCREDHPALLGGGSGSQDDVAALSMLRYRL